MASDKKLTFTVDADVSAGSKGFEQLGREAKRALSGVDEAVDETKSKARTLSDAFVSEFDKIDAHVDEVREAADLLGQALGPELAAKTNTADVIAQFDKLGVSAKECKEDIEAVADVVRRADQSSLANLSGETDKVGQSAKEARDAIDDIGSGRKGPDQITDSARGANSALANMVGNSAQDIGELTGVAGSAGVAVGQMAEYFSDASLGGEKMGSALRSMAAVVGPIAALAAISSSLGSIFAANEKRADRLTASTKQMSAAMKDGTASATDIANALGENVDALQSFDADARTAWGGFAEGATAAANALPLIGAAIPDDALQNITDLVPVFEAVGFKARDLGNAISEGSDSIWQYQELLRSAADAGKITADQAEAGAQFLGVQAEAFDKASSSSDYFTGAQEAAAEASKKLAAQNEAAAGKVEGFNRNQEDLAESAQNVADAMRDQADALNEQIAAATTAADATIAADDAQQRFIDSVHESNAIQNDAERAAEDKTKAVNDERDALIAAAKAQQEASDKTAAAQGITRTATQKVDDFNSSLLNNANYATPAARDAIADYIIEANGIPAEKSTEIRAAIAAGDIPLANALLADASRTRTAAIQADATNTAAASAELDAVANKQRVARIQAQVGGQSLVGTFATARASGGPVKKGEPYVVGEEGPEAFVPKQDGTIIPNGATVPSGIAGGGPVNITINMPPGSDGRDVVNAIKKYERVNGSGWRS